MKATLTIETDSPQELADITAALAGRSSGGCGGSCKSAPEPEGLTFDECVEAAEEMNNFTPEEIEESNDIVAEHVEVRKDCNGVPFNPNYCANAADPFYTSGGKTGQWKKKRGIDDATYNQWYAGILAGLKAEEPAPAPIDTAAAFGGVTPKKAAPATLGEWMGTISEHLAAGRLSQDQINGIYAAEQITDIFVDLEPSDNTPVELVAQRLQRLAGALEQCLNTQS